MRYDEELALSAGTTEQRIAHVVSNAVAEAGEQTDVGAIAEPVHLKSQEAMDEELETGLDAAEPPAERNSHHPGLTERVASFGRSPIVTFGLCAFFGAFIAAAIVFVTPADTILVAKQVLVWLTITLLALTLVYGAVHGVAYWTRRRGATSPGLVPQTDLAILNWRREKSVFLGTNQPQEDASWIFQLRMAELERAKSGRTSEARPWQRLAARIFDYAIWGLVLALLLSELRGMGVVPPEVAFWLGHPLLAPVLITGSWVPIEALLIASIGTTPGKWLFGVFLQFSISDAYARRDTRAQLDRAMRRSFRVWWEGIGCGFPLLAPVLIAVAYEKLSQNQETDWDFAQDVLVTHGPPGVLNTVTGVCGLAAMLWLYGVAWHQPMAESIAWARTTIAEAIPSPNTLTGGFAGGAGRISGLPQPPAAAAHAASRRRPARRNRRARATAPVSTLPAGAPASSASAPRRRAAERRADRHRRRRAVRRAEGQGGRRERRGSADAARRQLAARGRTVQGLDGTRARQSRSLPLPGPGAAGAGLPPGRDRRVPQGEAVRPVRPHARRRHRPLAEGHRRGLPQPISSLADRAERRARDFPSRKSARKASERARRSSFVQTSRRQ